MGADLHTHSVFSDGTTAPSENAALAAAEGLAGLALTDHDTVEGWPEAEAACAAHGLEFVPGVELSTEAGGASVHILGYWVDPDDTAFAAECARLRDERLRRAREILGRLAALGLDVTEQQVLAMAAGAPVGRPHLAAAMVKAGVVADVQAAFDDYLHDGGPAYVPKHALAPEDGVRLLRAAGGVPVLAHPGLSGEPEALQPLLGRLLAAGLAGIEVDHPSHEEEQRTAWRRTAEELGLVATGCSDFHGERKEVKIGHGTTPMTVVDTLREHRPRVSSTTQRPAVEGSEKWQAPRSD